MTDIKKINIYVGTVGQAYVDKETASKNLEAANKNVTDVEEIIEITNNYINTADVTLENANNARELANTVRYELENRRSQISPDSPVYAQLNNLLDELYAGDNDDDYLHGGNVNTADYNINNINALINELNDILSIANELLNANRNHQEECQTAFNNAKTTFDAYVVTEEESQSDISDKTEAELIDRLNDVANGLELAQQITDSINETSHDIQERSNSIAPEDPQEIQHTVIINVVNGTVDNESHLELHVANGASLVKTIVPNDGYKTPESTSGAELFDNTIIIRNIMSNIEINIECEEIEVIQNNFYYYIGWTLPTESNVDTIITETYPESNEDSTQHSAGKKTTSKSSFSLALINLYNATEKANYYVLMPAEHAIYDTTFNTQLGNESFISQDVLTIGNMPHIVYKSIETTRNITSIEIK